MATIKTQQELYDIIKAEIQANAPQLTDFEIGSINDTLAGVISSAVSEASLLIIDSYKKTFFSSAEGSAATGGADDLQALAVDHFGSAFSRPSATPALGTVTFTRATATRGAGSIPAGTIVKTTPNANGVSQRATVLSTVAVGALTLSINASVEMVTPGIEGNVASGTLVQIESALYDSSFTVTNALPLAGGAAEQDDATYRETIRNRIESLRGATKASIEATAKTVSGVVTATAIETESVVIGYNIATSLTTGPYFRIPYVSLYIADANGTASGSLIDDVQSAVDEVRAFGVPITTLAATTLLVDWTASIVLNPAGPNYSTLVSDSSQIVSTMTDYLKLLPIGTSFIRAIANAAMLAIWGPSGTNDIAAFTTATPVGDIAASISQKIIPNAVGII